MEGQEAAEGDGVESTRHVLQAKAEEVAEAESQRQMALEDQMEVAASTRYHSCGRSHSLAVEGAEDVQGSFRVLHSTDQMRFVDGKLEREEPEVDQGILY